MGNEEGDRHNGGKLCNLRPAQFRRPETTDASAFNMHISSKGDDGGKGEYSEQGQPRERRVAAPRQNHDRGRNSALRGDSGGDGECCEIMRNAQVNERGSARSGADYLGTC